MKAIYICSICGSNNITSFQGSKKIYICVKGHRQSKEKLKIKEGREFFSQKDDIVICKCGLVGKRIISRIKSPVYQCKLKHITYNYGGEIII